jgi:hypothetical protein
MEGLEEVPIATIFMEIIMETFLESLISNIKIALKSKLISYLGYVRLQGV